MILCYRGVNEAKRHIGCVIFGSEKTLLVAVKFLRRWELDTS